MTTDFVTLANFRFAIRRFLKTSERAALAAGLEPQQHQLLLALKALAVSGSDSSIAVLAERMQIKHHSVVGLIDRLEEKGFVRRCRSEQDRRRVEVQLSERGEETIERLSALHQRELNILAPELIALLQSVVRPHLETGTTD